MELHRLPWWVWTLISIPLGVMLAYSNMASSEPADGIRTDRQRDFERAVLTAPVTSAKIPWITNLIVYPPTEALGPGDKPVQISSASYMVLEPKPGGAADEYHYVRCWFRGAVPYVTCTAPPTAPAGYAGPDLPPGIEKAYAPSADQKIGDIAAAVYGKDTLAGSRALALANPTLADMEPRETMQTLIDAKRFRVGRQIFVPWNPDRGMTLRDWLVAASKDYNWVHYRYAWWKEPRLAMEVWLGGSVLVVGILWPMFISLLVGAGLVQGRVKADDFDITGLRKVKNTAAKVVKPEVAQADMDKVAAMNQQLTELLKEGLGERQEAAAAPAKPVEAAKPFVPPPPGDAPVAVPAAPQEEKEYKGEFYPVARPAEPKANEERH